MNDKIINLRGKHSNWATTRSVITNDAIALDWPGERIIRITHYHHHGAYAFPVDQSDWEKISVLDKDDNVLGSCWIANHETMYIKIGPTDKIRFDNVNADGDERLWATPVSVSG